MALVRPDDAFDREDEWQSIEKFIAARAADARIGVVYGRRRQGKSFLLDHAVRAANGFYYQALEEERTPALARFARALGDFAGAIALPGARFDDWETALRSAAEIAAGRPIVLDEFPYLTRTSPELPSVVQAAVDGSRTGRHPAFRLILCGSALSVMTDMLVGQSALRGRASLDMLIESFDYRQSREFWAIDDLDTAFLVNAVVGGPPGYRALLADIPAPANRDQLGGWLAEGVLNPSHALFREADYLLAEDPRLAERSLYQSVVAAVAQGAATRDKLANALGRKSTALEHPLEQLASTGFLVRDEDLLHGRRPLLRVVDPIIRFHYAVVRPDQPRFEARQTQEAWTAADERFRAQVLGPHFEALARTWTRRYASPRTLGGRPKRVGFTQVNDPELKVAFELDVVVEGDDQGAAKPHLLAIGEAKGSDVARNVFDLNRLYRLRLALAARADISATKLLLFGRSGFTPELRDEAAARRDVELVDLARLYTGS